MKRKKIQQLTKAMVAALSVGIFSYAAVPAQAANEIITGYTFLGGGGAGVIVTFNANTPGTIVSAHAISGTAGGEVLDGIDYFGGVLYGLGSAGNLYSINQASGATTLLGGGFGASLNGLNFGMDASAAGIRIVSDLDINLLLSPAGVVISSTPTITPSALNIDAIASQGSTMYAVDSLANTLNILNTATGTATVVGNMGYDVSGKNGFDISPATGVAYFSSPVSSSGSGGNLYTVNLTTGIASLVDQVGNGGIILYGLTVTPAVPEPSIAALFLAGGGGFGLLALARRRK